MFTKPNPPNAMRIALQDQISITALIVTTMALLLIVPLLIFMPQTDRDEPWQFIALLVAIGIGGLLMLSWRLPKRVQYIRDKWKRSQVQTAIVTDFEVHGVGNDRIRYLHYEYDYQGKNYQNREIISLFWKIEKGDTVDILVDPHEPWSALLLNVFNVERKRMKQKVN